MTLHPFLKLLADAGIHTAAPHAGTNGASHPPAITPLAPGDPAGPRYADAALRSEAARVASTLEGGRNDALNTAAFRLGQLAALGYLGEADIHTALLAASHACGLGPTEARQTIRSGLAAGLANVRDSVDLRGSAGVPPAYTLSLEADAPSARELTDGLTDALASLTDGPCISADSLIDGLTDVTDAGSVEDHPQGPSLDLPSARLIPGGTFIHEAPATVPAVWGSGDEVLWAHGEPLILTGPTGVGKTTLGGMVVAGRLGLLDTVLDQPVRAGERRTLVLAMDRPAQIQRAMARLLRAWPATLLDERLIVWKGPPPADLARHPGLLLQMAQYADADTVVLDSLKDAAVKLSDEETGQGISRAMNLCVAQGVEVLAYHHQTKRGAGGLGKPNSLADVYGSHWITAGAGSVLLLWGAAGDLVVELNHLKQPAGEVGPLRLLHDHDAGTTSLLHGGSDLFALLSAGPQSASALASILHGEGAGEAEVARVRRKLEHLVRDGRVRKVEELVRGAPAGHRGGSTGARYALVVPPSVTIQTGSLTDAPPKTASVNSSISAGQADHESVGQTPASVRPSLTDADRRVRRSRRSKTDGLTDVTDAPRPTLPPPSKGGGAVSTVIGQCDRCHTETEHFVPSPSGGRWCRVCAYPDPTTRPGYSHEEEKSW